MTIQFKCNSFKKICITDQTEYWTYRIETDISDTKDITNIAEIKEN